MRVPAYCPVRGLASGRVLRTWLLGVWLLTLGLDHAAAQANESQSSQQQRTCVLCSRIVPFLEGTDVFTWQHAPGEPETVDGATKFEAHIAPHLIFFQDFSDLIEIERVGSAFRLTRPGKGSAKSFSATPAVRLRMFQSQSSPVRTPSFMPRVNFQWLWATGRQQAVDGLSRLTSSDRTFDGRPWLPSLAWALDEGNSVRISVHEWHGSLGHHSNGQDDCFFDSALPDNRTVCVLPADTRISSGDINRTTGNFSTNFLRGGYNYRRSLVVRDDTSCLAECGGPTFRAKSHVGWGGELEWHPALLSDSRIAPYYGRWKAEARTELAWRDPSTPSCGSRFDVRASVKWVGRVAGNVPGLAWTAQATCYPTPRGGWGVFARYYRGQDYYNLGFLERIHGFNIGITYNEDGFFRFRWRGLGAP